MLADPQKLLTTTIITEAESSSSCLEEILNPHKLFFITNLIAFQEITDNLLATTH